MVMKMLYALYMHFLPIDYFVRLFYLCVNAVLLQVTMTAATESAATEVEVAVEINTDM